MCLESVGGFEFATAMNWAAAMEETSERASARLVCVWHGAKAAFSRPWLVPVNFAWFAPCEGGFWMRVGGGALWFGRRVSMAA